MKTKTKKEKTIKAWCVLKRGELKKHKRGEWVLPIMLDKTTAFGYTLFHKGEKVVPCEIIINL